MFIEVAANYGLDRQTRQLRAASRKLRLYSSAREGVTGSPSASGSRQQIGRLRFSPTPEYELDG
ncbi:hypothetical protein [Rhizobium sp. NXC24]|uniref:hypothetical protein n=1 Tax=Rhizobium sp. NXC24 TaxID=2048897 RepID=UPI000CDF527E|nr:hypothetical protein [Rhizobium sp. NXC24]AVA24386.1 hypothetical protein NXC24_PB00461 [Rhizobium sp. NXC24]